MAGAKTLWLGVCILFTLVLICSSYDGDEPDETGCPVVFQKLCTCKRQKYHYWKDPEEIIFMVNCTNTNFKDTSMLDTLPDGIQALIFTGNDIPVLHWNVFGVWNDHRDLEIVDMSNNKIQEIKGKAYHQVSYVKRLLLNHNDLIVSGRRFHGRILTNFVRLEELHLTNAFSETIDTKWYLKDLKNIFLASNLEHLKTLHLEQNEIWSITDDDMFCAFPSLTNLHLGDNQLQDIEFSLDCLQKLRYLDLQYNKIRRLTDATLNKLDKVLKSDSEDRAVHLKGNPFHCDCHLKNFQHWLLSTHTTLFHKDEIRCFDGYPERNAGRRVTNAEISECSPTHNSLTNVLLSILILVMIGLGLLIVYYHRQRIHSSFKPLVVSFQKSMQYRTIDKEEEPPTEVNV
ncbi:trophoblast glycoprotein-like [Tigriopus californicus]|nr:trophoblast glycoprotein-like [Tigriopus californicus]